MSELKDVQSHNLSPRASGKGVTIMVSPTDTRHFSSPEEYEATRTQLDRDRLYDFAGIWKDLGLTEDELKAAFERIRYGGAPTSPLEEPND